MNKFFELHESTKYMKAKISIFNLKGKADIWWEDVKQVRDIRTEDLSWHEFKRIFRNKYILERYYDSKAKELYELNMGSMIDEEYMTKFLELLRDHIEYDKPRSFEEFIGKLKRCYEHSKHKNESQQGWKWKDKDKGKGKWKPEITRPHNVEEKENVAPQKKLNVTRQGHGSHQQHRGDGSGWLECWTCGKEHLKRDCPPNQGGKPQIYSAHEA
eukprot:PITA_23658